MARKSVTGQLNMFDLFNNVDTLGEVQMVSLMPEDDYEEEVIPVVEIEPKVEIEREVGIEPKVEIDPKIKIEPEIEFGVEVEREIEVDLSRKTVSQDEQVAMCRTYEIDGEQIEIAYINYNKVRITRGTKAPEIVSFDSTKAAVDYYVEKMQELEIDE